MALSVPLGWSFLRSAVLDGNPASTEECPSLASFLAPNLQHTVEQRRTSGELSRSDRRALNLKVCDPTVQRLLGPVLGGVSDLAGLRSMAGVGPSRGGQTRARPVLTSLLARSGALFD